MKRFIALLLCVSSLLAFTACSKEPEDDGKALETANTVYNVDGNAGSITIDENVARTLLGVYSADALGLENSIEDYELKLSATRIFDSDACMVEAFSEGSETAEATFAILGQSCYVYSQEKDAYMLLTASGAVEVTASQNTESSSDSTVSKPENTANFDYDEDNNTKLQERFGGYGKTALGLDKELSKYIMVTTGTTTTAADGKTVYVIRLYEVTGEATNITFAFNSDGNYVFDDEANKFQKLK